MSVHVQHIDEASLLQILPVPSAQANKYTRGKLVLVAGCAQYPGAAAMASRAAQRSGAGYVQTYVEDSVQNAVRIMCGPSLVVRPWSVWDVQKAGAFSAHHPCAYAFGSGFNGEDSACQKLTLDAVRYLKAPLLLDGGAIGAISTEEGLKACAERAASGQVMVCTPHGGEAAGLARAAGIATDDPAERAVQISKCYGCVTVLKGPDTYISDGTRTAVMTEGTAALAKAGTGDVLAGIVGAFLAQGVSAFDAGVLGTTVHARAGVCAAHQRSDISVCPEDVIEYLPNVFLKLEQER